MKNPTKQQQKILRRNRKIEREKVKEVLARLDRQIMRIEPTGIYDIMQEIMRRVNEERTTKILLKENEETDDPRSIGQA